MSSSPTFPLHVSEEAGRTIVRFDPGTALNESNVEEFGRGIATLAQRWERQHLLVDLSGVDLLSSIALAKLITLNGRMRAAGGRLTLVNPSPIVRQVLKITRLDTVLEVIEHADVIPV